MSTSWVLCSSERQGIIERQTSGFLVRLRMVPIIVSINYYKEVLTMKEYIYYAKGFDEVFSVWARSAAAALAKVRREWGVSNLNVKIMER